MKDTTSYPLLIKAILVLISVFYLAFLYIDLYRHEYAYLSNNVKFTCIILCFILSLLSGKNSFDTHSMKLLQLGLFLTVIADYFLLIVRDYYEIGIIVFSVVQITYSIRYDMKNKGFFLHKYIVLLVVIFLSHYLINSIVRIDLLVPISIFYGACLIISVYKAIGVYVHNIYPKINGIMVFGGMILFLLCDINVAMYNIFKYLNKTDIIIYKVSNISIWLYYLPSQVLLSLSGYKYKSVRR
ncbi:MAG: hypothetical protein GX080_06875 [Tissierellia bacterium]|nr:hypothetical protein [Tissierellia bacterium]